MNDRDVAEVGLAGVRHERSASQAELGPLREAWRAAWPAAVAAWSPYVQLHEPIWCESPAEAQRESLTESFAMIRLVDHSVVINLARIAAEGLADFAAEILAHEAGHHVYCPGDLTDNARLTARIRAGLPTAETCAPMIANLYSDLLINDWLQRTAELDMAGVYRRLASPSTSRLWSLYLRIYESLWNLPCESLGSGPGDSRLRHDAQLGGRLVRSYAKDWLQGAGRFAALCLPYVLKEQAAEFTARLALWGDLQRAGQGGVPDGLTEIDETELTGAMHPSEDPALTGLLQDATLDDQKPATVDGRTPSELSGRKSERTYRQPFEYAEILKASGAALDARQITAQYYRERAIPYLIRFPTRSSAPTTELHLEGLDVWDVGSPLSDVDWLQTMLVSPEVIPGVTTRTRLHGETPGGDPHPVPLDLYLGVDCSGSMGDPARNLSYPVLAGAVMTLSALRAGARVKVVLSGEPGSTIATDGFVRDSEIALRTLTSYLGTGYSFGIHRLAETFTHARPRTRPVHALVLSDHDMFSMLEERGNGAAGWDVATEAAARCGGGATFLLQLPTGSRRGSQSKIARMESIGWNVALVDSLEELVEFARGFSRRHFER